MNFRSFPKFSVYLNRSTIHVFFGRSKYYHACTHWSNLNALHVHLLRQFFFCAFQLRISIKSGPRGLCWTSFWEGLGGLLERSWEAFGKPRCAQDGPRWRQDRARWRQDGPRWGLAGHLEATWGIILVILGGLGGDLCKKGLSIKMNTTMVSWQGTGTRV